MMLQGSILSSDDLMIKTAPLCTFMKFDGNKRLGIFGYGWIRIAIRECF